MPQSTNEHLITEQLSAIVDKQLSPTEQMMCDLHLQSCEQCQNTLLDLRQTVAFLHALPQPSVPRSFTLPANVTMSADTGVSDPASPAHHVHVQPMSRETRTSQNRRPLGGYYLRHSFRALSTIAAVVGLLFLLSGVVVSLSHFGGGAASTAYPYANTPALSSQTQSPSAMPSGQHPSPSEATAASIQPKAKTPSVPGVATVPSPATSTPSSERTLPKPPILDLSTAGGQEELGILLLVLGMVGVLVTRRRVRG